MHLFLGRRHKGGPQTGFPGGDQATAGNIDKVRDILFGAQMRDYEKRFARLEERLQKATSDLKDDLKKRFDSLESYVKKEGESLIDQLRTGQTIRYRSRFIARAAREHSGS